jgi:malonate-semialdehyde dehydrogenase (acetylating) / methylmalonate-semialdehyde dehydrogenase
MSAAPESIALPVISHWIGGRRTPSVTERRAPVYNPALGQPSALVDLASSDDVGIAVQAAVRAQPLWARTNPAQRARVLFTFRGLLQQHGDELARLISQEHGKTVDDARGEVARGLEVVEFACGIPQLLKGEYSESVANGVDTCSVRQPLGVVAGITPFNFPVMVPLWMSPVALACGNSFILKPSERDPSASLRLAELLQQAGLPDGVFNVVQGDKVAVDALLEHPDVAGVSFVGSTAVARHIQQLGTASGKRVQALGGAKNHMVILPDADLDDAVQALLGAAYGSAGERCMAISVAVAVGDAVADALIERLRARVTDLRIGPPDDPKTDMGPLVTAAHRERVLGYVDLGVREGAELVVDGRKSSVAGQKGFYLGGCLFDRVTPQMRIYQEEIFGPVLIVVRVPNLDAAIRLINAHPYANGTAVFTRSGQAARAFAAAVEVGMVGVNVPIPVPVAYHSFGGWRGSLFGDHHMYGPEGVRFYTRLKCVTSRWPDARQGSADFSMPVSK